MAGSALADVIVNPGAVGEGGATKTIDRFSQTYGANVAQTISGGFNLSFPSNDTFLETGGFTVNAFQLGGLTVAGTGLNNDYQLYGTFTATGSSIFVPSGLSGVIESRFSTFTVSLFLDRNLDTNVNTANGGAISGTTGDDLLVATGVLNGSGVNESSTNLNGVLGDFEALIDFTSTSAFFQGSPFTLLLALDGTVNVLQGPGVGFPLIDGVYDIRVQGDGRGVFVPAPASLGLLGAALAGLGLIRRRRA